MQRYLFFGFGVMCHGLFLVTFAWLAGFVGNLAVPKSIDSASATPLAAAVAIDLGLILLFGLQHSIMARPAFKRWWTQFVPQPIERSVYVLVSCLVTIVLVWQWRAIDLVIWDARGTVLEGVLWAAFAAGWLMVPLVSLMIHHFDLFGTRQVWLHLKQKPYAALPFRTPWLYRYVRHPLYIGWALAFWATPTMTAGHLLFAAALTAYMAIAAKFEERDLVEHFGQQYRDYQARVPAYIPRLAVAANRSEGEVASPAEG